MRRIFLFIILVFFTSGLSAQSNWGIGVEGGVSFPISEFSESYKTGYSGNIRATYIWGENTLLSFSVGLSQWEVDNSKVNQSIADAGINAKVDLDANLRIIPILVGVKWYFIKGKYRPYILIEGGFHNYKSSIKGTITDTSPGASGTPVPIQEISDSGTETALSIGAGSLLKLSNHWYLEFTGKYNVLTNARALSDPDDNQTISGISRTIQYITLLLGINYRF
jgi:opacity protein-like surface antigen